MAAVTQKLADGGRQATFRFTNDDTDESSGVVKIDISDSADIDPGGPNKIQPTSLNIQRVWYNVGTVAVQFYFAATADQIMWTFHGDSDGYIDFRPEGGLPPVDTGAAGFTGDFGIITSGAIAASTAAYSFVVEFEKRYD